MATACIPQVTFGFEPKEKPVVAAFDMPHASSDGGAVLLKRLDTQLQLGGCEERGIESREPEPRIMSWLIVAALLWSALVAVPRSASADVVEMKPGQQV